MVQHKYFIGIDSGTSVVKAVVISENGDEKGKHGIPIPNAEDPATCYSHDMANRWELTKRCIAGAIKEAGINPRDVVGIGITAQGAGTWMIDEAGEPTHPGICWCDGRAVKLAESMHKDGTAEKVYSLVGNAVYSGSQGVQLRWLKENRPFSNRKTIKACFWRNSWKSSICGPTSS